MGTDPFKVIDDIFHGIVQFVFNFLNSLGGLARNPIRGTIRLVVRYEHDQSSQISYTAALFLLNALDFLYGDVAGRYSGIGLYSAIASHIVETLRGAGTTNTILGAVTATAIQRLWIVTDFGRRRGADSDTRTTLRVGYLFLYFYLLWISIQSVTVAIANYGAPIGAVFGIRFLSDGASLIAAVFFTISSLFSFWLLFRARILIPRELRPKLFWMPFMFVASLMIAASVISILDRLGPPRLSIVTLHCSVSLAQKVVEVDGMVTNTTEQLLILKRSDIKVLGRFRVMPIVLPGSPAREEPDQDVFFPREIEPDDSFGPYIALEPKRATAINFKTRSIERLLDQFSPCGLRISAVDSDTANDETGLWPLPSKYRAEAYERR